jgi:hypothetical protein
MPDMRETDVQTWREIEVSVVTGIWSTTDAAPPGPTVARARRCTASVIPRTNARTHSLLLEQ